MRGMSIEANYDADADIAWLGLPGRVTASTVSEESPTGLRDLDPQTGELVGLEIWRASEVLPAELLRMLPPPPVRARA